MTNHEIAQLLRNVATAYAIKDEKAHRFQIIAYQKAADAIESSTTQIKDLIQENRLDELPGIGASIRQHLEELIKTGKVQHFASVLNHVPGSVFPLLEVPSFGPKKAYRLVKEFRLNNPKTVIADVEKIAKQGKIEHLEGFGEKSQSDILRAITEYKAGMGKTTRMPLPYAFEVAQKLIEYLTKSDAVIRAFPLGSLRRMKSTVGDIDIAVSTNKPEEVMEYFVSYPYKERIIEKGEISSSIMISGGKQVDLMVQPPTHFGSLLQHFTGSKAHNIHLRDYALSQKLSLSEKGIKYLSGSKKWKSESFKTEEEFYKFLGMDWIPPEIREDTGEIEAALVHKLPKLVETKDIKGDLHIHSHFPIEPSHDLGVSSMEEMLKEAKKLGYEYLGFSEHNPSQSKHSNKQIYSLLKRKKEKIEQINSGKKYVRAFNLLETDILPNGKLAIDEKSLSLLDATLVSIHSSFSMNKTDMTKRILTGLSHPKAKILSHPSGRMLNVRSGYALDWEQLFDFVVKNNKALEINSWPERLDLPDSLVRQALKYHVKFVINTDSHAVGQMDMMKYGVSVARRGWCQKHDILNTLGYNDFKKWLES